MLFQTSVPLFTAVVLVGIPLFDTYLFVYPLSCPTTGLGFLPVLGRPGVAPLCRAGLRHRKRRSYLEGDTLPSPIPSV